MFEFEDFAVFVAIAFVVVEIGAVLVKKAVKNLSSSFVKLLLNLNPISTFVSSKKRFESPRLLARILVVSIGRESFRSSKNFVSLTPLYKNKILRWC